ncbi:MAG: phage virion morphogenesis protein [Candidatus Gastranaerophilales bacterium]|nr:phage virion morphogenesis protein [Candidatus Gastranaerophilales bacterium]
MIEINIDKKKLEAGLSLLKKKVKNLRPVMRAISEDMLYAVKENFDTQGSRLGEKWADLSATTQAARKKKGYNPNSPKLQQERKLYDSITAQSTNSTAQVGSILPYARLHHFGGNVQNPGGVKFIILKDKFIPLKKDAKRFMGITKPFSFHVPARPIFQLNNDDINGIQSTIGKYLNIV